MSGSSGILGLGLAVLLSGAALAETATPGPGLEDYRRAEAMQAQNLAGKVLNATLDPIWLPDGDGFWYRRELAGGKATYMAVDPTTGRASIAFDHARLAAAMTAASDKPADPDKLNLEGLTFSEAGRIQFGADGQTFDCDLANLACKSSASAVADPYSIRSPDGRMAAFVRDNDLWVKDTASGAERRLTHDGEAYFAYGKVPDRMLLKVMTAKTGLRLAPFGLEWSPDSRFIVATRTDERSLRDYNFLQTLPFNGSRRPLVIPVRTPLSGEEDPSAIEVSIIDASGGGVRKLALDKSGVSTLHYWAPDGSRFLALQGGDYSRKTTLFEVTVATGAVRPVISESSETFLQSSPLEYDEPALRFLPGTNEFVWFSQKDGLNHLYLVDVATGRIKARITKGDLSIQNVIRVDEKARRIWFTAVGRDRDTDPYYRHLYRTSLDGGAAALLTPSVGDHDFPGAPNPVFETILGALGAKFHTAALISPSGRFLVDPVSTPDRPTVFTLRRADGKAVAEFERADASAAMAQGWILPETFRAKAADGKTDVYGLIVHPHGFDPARRYPVVEDIYNGPQVVTTPHNFPQTLQGLGNLSQVESFAQLGFVVVIMDGRGTPLRDKAFQDYMYNNMQEFAVEDHVAALRQLAAARPYMDIDRLGVFGHSFGGYSSMKAILGYPDFYKAAVSSAGPYDMYAMYPLDGFFRPPVFKDGAKAPTGPGDHPSNWGEVDLTRFADRLKGDLMIAYADTDENAYPAATVRMVQALTAANKSFDLIMMPGRGHSFSREPYFIRRRWDFFVRKLEHAEPPRDYAFGAAH